MPKFISSSFCVAAIREAGRINGEVKLIIINYAGISRLE